MQEQDNKTEEQKNKFGKQALNDDMSSEDLDEIQKRPSSKGGKKVSNSWLSLWPILFIVLGLIFLWNTMYKPPQFEIPIMQFVKLIEQGNPSTASIEETPDKKLTDTPFIEIQEKKGKNKKIVKYSLPDDICISPNDVTGSIQREVISVNGESITEKTERVPFFTGRQGLNFDNNELFNQLKKGGFENVSAKGPPGFMEKYGLTLLTTALLIFFIFFILSRMGAGAMAFGRNRGILVAQEDVDISFSDVAGVDEAVDELREIVEFLKVPNKFRILGGRIPKGVLLVGPPGTGKTLLAKAVAGEAGVPFFSLSGSDFVELYAGVGAARVRDLFQQAEHSAPCIIFIDELDALGKARSGNSFGAHDEREQTLNALLVEMDGFETNTNVIVMAATNRPEILDSALLRSGRFDRQVLVDRPDICGREEILKIHSKNVKLDESIDLHKIACITSGFVGADLAALVNEAALLAARAEKRTVTIDEFTEGVERVTTGLQKKRRVITDEEKKRVSYHECGHALAAYFLPNTDPVHKVSIIPRGLAALGYTLQRPEDERFLMTRLELESRIQVLLAGTIAEKIVYEDISTGAQNDLERATEIARNMVTSFGMSRLGPINFHEKKSSFLNSDGLTVAKEHSEQTAWEIDQEVRSIIDTMYDKTMKFLEQKKNTLLFLAQRLLQKEVLDSDELKDTIITSENENKENRVVSKKLED